MMRRPTVRAKGEEDHLEKGRRRRRHFFLRLIAAFGDNS